MRLILLGCALLMSTGLPSKADEPMEANLDVQLETPVRIESHQPLWWKLSLSGMKDFARSHSRPFNAMFEGYTITLRHADSETTVVPPFVRYPMWERGRGILELGYTIIEFDGKHEYVFSHLLQRRYAALSPGRYLLTVRPELLVARENTPFLSGEFVRKPTASYSRVGDDVVIWRLPPVSATFQVVAAQPEAKQAALQRVRDLIAEGRTEAVTDDDWCALALSDTPEARDYLAAHLEHASLNARTILCCQLLNVWPKEEALDQAQAWLRANESARLDYFSLEVFRRLGTPADAMRLREFLKPEAQGGNKYTFYTVAHLLGKPIRDQRRTIVEQDIENARKWLDSVELDSPSP